MSHWKSKLGFLKTVRMSFHTALSPRPKKSSHSGTFQSGLTSGLPSGLLGLPRAWLAPSSGVYLLIINTGLQEPCDHRLLIYWIKPPQKSGMQRWWILGQSYRSTLPIDIREISSLNILKRKLITYILTLAFN